MIKRCPVCGGDLFVTTAHVLQEWLVNESGYCLDVVDDCLDISYEPDDDNIWTCYKCGYDAGGREFNVEE